MADLTGVWPRMHVQVIDAVLINTLNIVARMILIPHGGWFCGLQPPPNPHGDFPYLIHPGSLTGFFLCMIEGMLHLDQQQVWSFVGFDIGSGFMTALGMHACWTQGYVSSSDFDEETMQTAILPVNPFGNYPLAFSETLNCFRAFRPKSPFGRDFAQLVLEDRLVLPWIVPPRRKDFSAHWLIELLRIPPLSGVLSPRTWQINHMKNLSTAMAFRMLALTILHHLYTSGTMLENILRFMTGIEVGEFIFHRLADRTNLWEWESAFRIYLQIQDINGTNRIRVSREGHRLLYE